MGNTQNTVVEGNKRGSGRTTRMILRAICEAEAGEVFVVMTNDSAIVQAAHLLAVIIGPRLYYDALRRYASWGTKQKIWFILRSNHLFNHETQRIYGTNATVFIDHEIAEIRVTAGETK